MDLAQQAVEECELRLESISRRVDERLNGQSQKESECRAMESLVQMSKLTAEGDRYRSSSLVDNSLRTTPGS